MSVAIRPARMQDYGAICALLEEVDELHRERFPRHFRAPVGPTRSREYMTGLLENPETRVLLAEVDEQPAGVAILMRMETPPVPILVPRRYVVVDTLVVRADLRKQGVGRALMDASHQWALDQGASSVMLTVYCFNQDAIRFYEELGYAVTNQRMEIALTPRDRR